MVGVSKIEAIKKNVMNIKTRKYFSTAFFLDEKTKSEYVELISIKRNVKSKGTESNSTSSSDSTQTYIKLSTIIETCSSVRDVPCIENLKKHFEELKNYLEKDHCYYIVYDFGFYNEEKAFRTVMCLISYIPDEMKDITDKFAYSSNSITLKRELEIGKSMTINNWEQLSYEYISDLCASYSKF